MRSRCSECFRALPRLGPDADARFTHALFHQEIELVRCGSSNLVLFPTQVLSSSHMNSAPEAAGDARQFAPSDRETFDKAQKRNRTATWRMSALCFVAALIMGIPLTLVLTPLFYAVTLIIAEIIIYFFTPFPPALWPYLIGLTHLVFDAVVGFS